jgi:hypothetical protein
VATLGRIVVAVFVGVLLGLVTTIHTLDEANVSLAAGPWRSSERTSTGELNPYVLAANARAGLLPLGPAEGLSFIADTDSKGVGLSGRCDYAVTGPAPGARFWTLSLLTPDGTPIANPAERYGFTSAEVLRFDDEPFIIIVSAEARSGNWLPTGHAKHYVLMLRLYDTGLSTVGTVLRASAMPTIKRLRCD